MPPNSPPQFTVVPPGDLAVSPPTARADHAAKKF
jgi:hypothetical protein